MEDGFERQDGEEEEDGAGGPQEAGEAEEEEETDVDELVPSSPAPKPAPKPAPSPSEVAKARKAASKAKSDEFVQSLTKLPLIGKAVKAELAALRQAASTKQVCESQINGSLSARLQFSKRQIKPILATFNAL